jgi:DNA-binding GntR family transcriptional regulator
LNNVGGNHVNLDQKVYKKLKQWIFERKLIPGAKVYQERIARELGISRTPLIAALKKLEQEKLIVAVPRRGFLVRRVNRREMLQLFELREVLEGLAARKAALTVTAGQIAKLEALKAFFTNFKAGEEPEASLIEYGEQDKRLHQYLIDLAGNDVLSGMLETCGLVSYSYMGGFESGLIRHPHETIPEHLMIIDAVCRKDPVRAERSARRHMRHSINRMMEISPDNPLTRER